MENGMLLAFNLPVLRARACLCFIMQLPFERAFPFHKKLAFNGCFPDLIVVRRVLNTILLFSNSGRPRPRAKNGGKICTLSSCNSPK